MHGNIKSCIFILLCTFYLYSSQDDFNFSIKNIELASSNKTAYLFSHGLANTHEQGYSIFSRYSVLDKPRWLVDGPLGIFDFPDAKCKGNYHHKEVNLGQEKDLERLHYAYGKMVELLPEHDIVLMGISRGSAVTLNYAALYQPEKVKALVVESPFDKLTSVIKHLLMRYHLSWVPFSKSLGFKVCQKYFPHINLKGIFPLDLVEKIPSYLPIMLIHSKKDRVIPINSSRRLYIKLKETGHEEVYLVELQSGNHGNLIYGPDADFYNYAVHAFYKKYNLSYNPEFAQHGQNLLQLCQPSPSEVLQRMKRKRSIDEEDEIDEYEFDLVIDEESEITL